MENIYDIIIIGEGIAGMTAAIYAKRAGASVLILEKNAVGGQASLSYEIGNYPGFDNISGFELVSHISKQVKELKVDTRYEQVQKIQDGKIKSVFTKNNEYRCKAIILCLGASPRKLGIEKEKQLIGKGISYCAVCDGAFYRNKNVAIIGRGNTAAEDACYLSNIANNVYIINHKSDLKAQSILVSRIQEQVAKEKIKMINNSEVVDIIGENKVEAVKIQDLVKNVTYDLKVDGIFVATGRVADTDWLDDLVEVDENGYIIVDKYKRTNREGIYSAGDCTNTVLRQLITSAADGAIAGTNAYEYVKNIIL